MRSIYLLPPAVFVGIALLMIGGCEDKKKTQAKAAPATTPAQVTVDQTRATYLTSAKAIPNTLNPDWEVNSAQQPQAEVMVSQAPQTASVTGKSAYRMHYETRNAGTAATVASAPKMRTTPAVSQRVTAEIDSDLLTDAARPASAGLGRTGDGAKSFDVEGPEIGRDLDAPKFTMTQPAKPAVRPVARAAETKQPVARRTAARQMPEGPELGYVSPVNRSRY